MLETKSEKVGRIVDGKLTCTIKGHSDLFEAKDRKVKAAEAALNTARLTQWATQKKHILSVFRQTCNEFCQTYGDMPTLILMNYHDINILFEAYNDERRELEIDRPNVYSTGDDNERVVDGIKVKQGCDQMQGQIRIYSFE